MITKINEPSEIWLINCIDIDRVIISIYYALAAYARMEKIYYYIKRQTRLTFKKIIHDV